MSATGLLLFLLGLWIIINTPNLVDVIQGKTTLGLTKPTATNTGHGPTQSTAGA